jgi:hypothetical protein
MPVSKAEQILEALKALFERAARCRRRTQQRAAARRVVEAIDRQARERTEAGLALRGLPDLSPEGERDSFYQAQLIRELALRHMSALAPIVVKGKSEPVTIYEVHATAHPRAAA